MLVNGFAFENANKLTVKLFVNIGKNTILDFRVKFVTYDYFKLSWKDTENILKIKAKLNTLYFHIMT